MAHGTLRVERDRAVARVVLDRPAIRNAFNDEMLADLREAFQTLRGEREIRVIVLAAAGPAFCAGADLHWMRRVLKYSYEQNYQDSLALVEALRAIDESPQPVIGRIHGAAIGGGTGVVAACDIAIASQDAVFAFSETKLGLTPAVISPYLLRRMGERNLREYFLTGERFSAARAVELGLVNAVVPAAELDAAIAEKIGMLVSGGPQALSVSKALIRRVREGTLEENGKYTAELIARLRMSDEGQEGMNAFLEKRPPRWVR